MSIFSILACPHCKTAVERAGDALLCVSCRRTYPIVDGTPVMLPDGSVPDTAYQEQLSLRSGYDEWIHRVVLQSLPASSIVLEIGAGNMALDLANVVRMDVTLTPYVDVVGDAHALPFLPHSFDFIFSLAVIEHLRQPFVAAEEAYNALRDGGYLYGECNFVFPYHGYPFHFFNATAQGMEHVFAAFHKLRSGVAPYQMPSFALRALIESYVRDLGGPNDRGTGELRLLLQQALEHPLGTYDRYFGEDAAVNTAAGTYFFGYKSSGNRSAVIPEAIEHAWQRSTTLQQQFPDLRDLGSSKNVMLWAFAEADHDRAMAAALAGGQPFRKHETSAESTAALRGLPVVEAVYGNIPEPERERALHEALEARDARNAALDEHFRAKNEHIARLEHLLRAIERGRINRMLQLLRRLWLALAAVLL